MSQTASLIDIAPAGFRHGPMPCRTVSIPEWEQAALDLAGGTVELMSLWAAEAAVHMALRDGTTGNFAILRLDCPSGNFPSVGRRHAPAQRLERTVRDLHGLAPTDAPDGRPWLDHGRWLIRHPLGMATPSSGTPEEYAFLPTEGRSLHRVPVGPVHAGIIEPGHFRFTAQGETVVRLEERLGYVHKGIDTLMSGADIARGCELAGRTSGDSTVAYAWAYAQAVEAAFRVAVPERALWLRAVAAELERLANHLGDIGAICNDAAFGLLHTHCAVLRERVLRTAETCFGHRMVRDYIVPGGVAVDLEVEGVSELRELLALIGATFPSIAEVYDYTPSLKDRTVLTGHLKPELANRFAAGGFVGRASGRDFDTRRDAAYAPYDRLSFDVPILHSGDVNARVWVRILEVEQSLSLLAQCLDQLPVGAFRTEVVADGAAREGLGLVEGFRGDILVWLALDAEARITRCHIRDPSWFQWPLLEAVIEDNIIADFPLCNKSFNCSYSGHDM
jgi:Ni,Fe-hydrogenase III large subunit